ncbi:hypothetical protein PP707_06700 [Acetobacter pasteurianus]|nr:hypothetical protein [Acetobacter pasteurianus]
MRPYYSRGFGHGHHRAMYRPRFGFGGLLIVFGAFMAGRATVHYQQNHLCHDIARGHANERHSWWCNNHRSQHHSGCKCTYCEQTNHGGESKNVSTTRIGEM